MERVSVIDRCGFEGSLRGRAPLESSDDRGDTFLLPSSELFAYYAWVLSIQPSDLGVDMNNVLGQGSAATALAALALAHPDLPRQIRQIDVSIVVLSPLELMTAARLSHLYRLSPGASSILTTLLLAPLDVRFVVCRRHHPPALMKLTAQYGRRVIDLEHPCVMGA